MNLYRYPLRRFAEWPDALATAIRRAKSQVRAQIDSEARFDRTQEEPDRLFAFNIFVTLGFEQVCHIGKHLLIRVDQQSTFSLPLGKHFAHFAKFMTHFLQRSFDRR